MWRLAILRMSLVFTMSLLIPFNYNYTVYECLWLLYSCSINILTFQLASFSNTPSKFVDMIFIWKDVHLRVSVEIYTPTYVSPNMHMTCLLLAQDTQEKIVCVSDLLVIIVQSGSGALAPVTGFLGKWSQWTWKLSWMSWISEWCNSRRCLAKQGKERPHWKRD